ncbi:putative 39S ribosomal protein L45, mitochondrial [Lamellibrachia satsuma]|nr:putative 39S ribosomal protein L45, mitochondrial [Lamellibrachia satsuma]
MAASIGSRMCLRCPSLNNLAIQRTSPVLTGLYQQHVRERHSKHYEPKWRKLRAQKVIKVNVPDWNKLQREANFTPEEMRTEMKKKGILPPRTFQERSIIIASTSSFFEEYVPPEGDGLASLVSGAGAKQRMTELEKKGKSYMQLRKIKQFDEDFDTKVFPDEAQDIYIKANKLLENYKENEDDLHELVTEKAYPEMIHKLDKKTLRWEFIKSLEPPRVVHLRTTHLISKENMYAQVTVRLHTQQTLALYDRFGRLMYGGENLVKDCLEYVVYEKHLSDEYGRWRVHGKIIPTWMPPPPSLYRTMKQPHFDPVEDNEDKGSEVTQAKPLEGSSDRTLATA